ncbi:MAG: DNA adenine methylase (dam) [Candidatus Kentron sp. G]|nr:MAG: DNA adenine methylase (dam) [Candidatus Kentron sp. G]VFN01950.1 MAG: DNA adenine methylase (dam) [Candidatus Kentron sp. G]VFN03610.1 MAG: DNA adenine methylase (dam) [Candidatus Kentron sp. G]
MTDNRTRLTSSAPAARREKQQASPFVKWAGGKRHLVPEIIARLPKSFGTYYEPFVGGGAVFFALAGRAGKAALSDTNAELMLAYEVIRDTPEALMEQLDAHKKAHRREEYYYQVRERRNAALDSGFSDKVASAVRFIYLNKTGYNGLYRVNSRGGFNVPKGRYENPAIYNRENILAISEVLKNTTLETLDFADIDPRPEDFIYCDPPYDDAFNSYADDGFGEADQKRLKDCMDRWREKGCHVMLSNSDTPLIRALYKGYRIEEVEAPRYINSKAAKRGMTTELLVMSYDTGIPAMAKRTKSYERIEKSYYLFLEYERTDKPFSLQEIVEKVGWAQSTARTYPSKKWRPFITRLPDDKFKVDGLDGNYSLDDYVRLMSQADHVSNDPKKPALALEVERLVTKARESAMLALDIYNRPATLFRTEGFLVMMVIAWRALFHAVFERDKVDYRYRNNDGTQQLIDGEPKAWDLAECVKRHWGSRTTPEKKNLEFAILLRNRIEHRYVPALDPHVAGECQSLLLNFDKLLSDEFTSYYALRESLAMSLQTSSVREGAQMEAIKKFQGEQYDELRDFLDEYRDTIGDEIYSDPKFSFRVYLIPRLGNHESSSDMAVEFIRAEDMTPELKEQIAFIKEKRVPVANQGYLKPKNVVPLVADRIKREFKIHHHTQAWKMYGVRASGQEPSSCKLKYCQFDEVHGDHIYTNAWVEFLVEKLSSPDEYERLMNYRHKEKS